MYRRAWIFKKIMQIERSRRGPIDGFLIFRLLENEMNTLIYLWIGAISFH